MADGDAMEQGAIHWHGPPIFRLVPKMFTAIADAVDWVVKQDGVDFILHYLDDFLLVGAPAYQECTGALTTVECPWQAGPPCGLGQVGGPRQPAYLPGVWTRLHGVGYLDPIGETDRAQSTDSGVGGAKVL